MANFRVPYAPGVLRAVALQGGKPVAEAVLRTVGEPMRVRLTADRASCAPTAKDLAFRNSGSGGRQRPAASERRPFQSASD